MTKPRGNRRSRPAVARPMRPPSLALILALAATLAVPAWARAPTPEETARIEAALRAAGYVAWGPVEVGPEGDRIRVTAARRTTDGPTADVVVEPTTQRVTEEVPN